MSESNSKYYNKLRKNLLIAQTQLGDEKDTRISEVSSLEEYVVRRERIKELETRKEVLTYALQWYRETHGME